MFRLAHDVPLIPILMAVAMIAAGCGERKTGKSTKLPSVSAPGLGITVASVPSGFKVQAAEADRILLVPADPGLGGSIEIAGLTPEAGTNLQEAVTSHRKGIEERAGGRYLGAQELAGPLGTAYWSRGRYETGGLEMEETWILTLDPSQGRILRLSYVYPAGSDSKDRVSALLDLAAELEPYQAPESRQGD